MAANSASGRVFVVDDDRGLLRLMEKALLREGFSVATAVSGREAIGWLTRNRVDLMLLDLKLSDMEGKELTNHLASIACSVPFVVITGQGDERIAVELMKGGALDYVVKDADFLAFLPVVVRQALDRIFKDRKLAQMERDLRESEARVLESSEREQRRIGQDLHDGLGQQLTAIELMCQSLKRNPGWPSGVREVQIQMDEICRHIRNAIALTRSLARGLVAFKLESGGLEAALKELAQSATVPGMVRCEFKLTGGADVSDARTAGQFYRIAQEAVSNALRHGHSKKIAVRLALERGASVLEIKDNGQGFPETVAPAGGLGLNIMRYRAALIGAELDLKSTPGKGVTVRCSLPAQNQCEARNL